MKRWSQQIRSRHLFVVDLVGLVVTVLVAFAAWQNRLPGGELVGTYLWIGGIIVCAHVVASILLGLYTNSWRYASIGDMGRVLACTFTGSAAAWLLVTAVWIVHPPDAGERPAAAFWLIETTLALGVLATPRFLIRAASDLGDGLARDHVQERTLLYGAGWAGVMVARSAERTPASGVTPVGFLDDNLDLKGRRVAGLPVFGGTDSLGKAKRRTGATALLITMPRAEGTNVRRVLEAAMTHGLDVRTVPAMTDLIDGTIDATQSRRVRVEDLLRRPPAIEHAPELRQLLAGRTVMITGAAGSIGSELVRQVLALEPGRIVMVDQAESSMYMVARDLENRSSVVDGATSITTHLLDITDRYAVGQLMRETAPVVVFHAAAYKHVPMLEDHISEAVRVNIGGTASVVGAAADAGVERFVLVSTDKAVKPSSVMGATKRIAEMIVADAAQRTGRAYVSVRFGNVLGSNGSVIPVFQSQLENNQPLTITDPAMTRYFMTIPEAAWLILDAAAISESGCLYVLDMGEPVRVLDLANDLIRLSGRDPNSVPITITGLRPGEKLHEELFYAHEDVTPTAVPKVLRSTNAHVAPPRLQNDIEHFVALSRGYRNYDSDELRTALLAYVSTTDADEPEALAAHERIAVPVGPVASGHSRPVVPVHVYTNGGSTRYAVEPSPAGNGSVRSEPGPRAAGQARA